MPSSKRQAAVVKRAAGPAKRPRFEFIVDTISELKKVTWLTRRETAYLTALVLLVAVSAGIVLGLIDLGLSELVDRLLLGS